MMKKILTFLLTCMIGLQVNAQYTRLRLNQIQKDTISGSVLISSPTDSNMVYSRDIKIENNKLIVFGDTIATSGDLASVLVDSVTIYGNGFNSSLYVDTNLIKDIIGAMVNAGLGIDITYDPIDKELLIESLSVEDSVKNGTGSSIPKGTPLYVTGVSGNFWEVAPADASDINKMPVVAIAGETIGAGAEGIALIKGHIKGVNTSAFSAGDEVYVAPGGGYTNVRPKGESNLVQFLGTVVKADANGGGIINLGEIEQNLNPGRIFIGDTDSTITRVTLKDSISSVIGDSLSFYVSKTLLNDSLANYVSRQELTDTSIAIRNDIPLIIEDSLNNYLPLSDYIIDSTRLNTTGDSLLYYQNGVLLATQAIAGGGGSLQVYQQSFQADGIDSTYEITESTLPNNLEQILVFQNGLVVENSNVSVIPVNTIQLAFLPDNLDRIVVVWYKGSVVEGPGIDSVFTDNTLLGNGLLSNSLRVDTTVIATLSALTDSLSGIISTVSTDVTLLGDGTSGNVLKVDTTIISTIAGLNDSLATKGTVNSITAGTFLSGGTITSSGTIALDTASAGLKTYISENSSGGSSFNNLTETADTVFVAKFLDVDTSTLYVDAVNNRVGIGTSSPTETLTVNGNSLIYGTVNTVSNSINFRNYRSSNVAAAGPPIMFYRSGNTYESPTDVADTWTLGYFRSHGYYDGAYRVGARLDFVVDGTPSATNMPTAIVFRTNNNSVSTNPDIRMQIEADGDVVITGLGNGSSSQEIGVDLNGKLIPYTSDARLKQKTNDELNAIDKIKSLNPLYYKWLDFESMGTKEYFGFFAQDIQNVMPSAVYNVGQTDYYGYDKTAIIALNTKAIQEQQAIIETQKQEIDTLKTQIQNILTEINNLKNN